jgi:hypothetical protein
MDLKGSRYRCDATAGIAFQVAAGWKCWHCLHVFAS